MFRKKFSPHVLDVIRGMDDVAHRRLWVKNGKGNFEKILGYGERDTDYECYCELLKEIKDDGDR